jgi:tRNA nucleotidyltransferase (CCA-adding enzyme)
MKDELPPSLTRVLTATPELCQSYLVGGCVRDWLLGIPQKDYDIEVFGIDYEQLVRVLSRWGRTDLVGRSFGVVKLSIPGGETFDFTIPRRDSKIGPGHKGFQITFDPAIDPRDAAARRDFTINSLMYHVRTGEMLDFFNGANDLKHRLLRHTSPAFVEDPLRVLRGMQFVARFRLQPAPETLHLCRQMKTGFRELAPERVREEWFKWAAKSEVPSLGLSFLATTEWLEFFPEIDALRGTPQDPEWHPEGDVFVHTGHACDALTKLPLWQAADSESRIVYMLAVLAHDFGKSVTTSQVVRDGKLRIVSPGHDEAGGPLAEQFLARIHAPHAIRERVVPLVVNHMAHLQGITDRSVRRLAKRLEPENIDAICLVMAADSMGRPPKPPIPSERVELLRKKAGELQVQSSAMKPILLGRHLIELGLKPGKEFSPLLESAYDAQIEGRFADLLGAKRWLFEQRALPLPAEAREALAISLGNGSGT